MPLHRLNGHRRDDENDAFALTFSRGTATSIPLLVISPRILRFRSRSQTCRGRGRRGGNALARAKRQETTGVGRKGGGRRSRTARSEERSRDRASRILRDSPSTPAFPPLLVYSWTQLRFACYDARSGISLHLHNDTRCASRIAANGRSGLFDIILVSLY